MSVVEQIFHAIGICPDSASHWDLLDAITVNGQEVWMALNVTRLYFKTWVMRIASFLSRISLG
jgi:hypothetical protein